MRYLIHMDVNMTVPGPDKDQVRNKLEAMIRGSGFEDKDFELEIKPLEEEKSGPKPKRSRK